MDMDGSLAIEGDDEASICNVHCRTENTEREGKNTLGGEKRQPYVPDVVICHSRLLRT